MDICTKDSLTLSLDQIADRLLEGRRLILLGDYGAGKSTTFREVFFKLRNRYLQQQCVRFPIYLNLRNHHGQLNLAEALERHARDVGFPTPSHLVRAWRAGYAVLLLDGFDELGAVGWLGLGKAKKLKDLRFHSTSLIRSFVRECPEGAGIFISGRGHYFDSEVELLKCLEIGSGDIQLTLYDFTDEQVSQYLNKRGWTGQIPSWFPSRPLLLGYLASKDLIRDVMVPGAQVAPEIGWDILLSKIADRESHIAEGIDGETVRRIIERLASKARCFQEPGLGPLFQDQLVQAFRDECGYEPDDKGIVLLQRLPGLGARNDEDGSREFIDKDLADVARAGDVIRFIMDPHKTEIHGADEWQCTLGPLGRDVDVYKCTQKAFSSKKMSAAIEQTDNLRNDVDCLKADVFQIMAQMGSDYTGNYVTIRGVLIQELALDSSRGNFSRVALQSCLVKNLDLCHECDASKLPRFSDCYMATVTGVVSVHDLPSGVFDEKCTYEAFGEGTATTSAILDTTLSLNTRVLLTILRKLYLQAGSGRRHSALVRGLDHKARPFVDDLLKLLRKEDLVIESSASSETVWLPVRKQAARVRRLLSAPTVSRDMILERVKSMDA